MPIDATKVCSAQALSEALSQIPADERLQALHAAYDENPTELANIFGYKTETLKTWLLVHLRQEDTKVLFHSVLGANLFSAILNNDEPFSTLVETIFPKVEDRLPFYTNVLGKDFLVNNITTITQLDQALETLAVEDRYSFCDKTITLSKVGDLVDSYLALETILDRLPSDCRLAFCLTKSMREKLQTMQGKLEPELLGKFHTTQEKLIFLLHFLDINTPDYLDFALGTKVNKYFTPELNQAIRTIYILFTTRDMSKHVHDIDKAKTFAYMLKMPEACQQLHVLSCASTTELTKPAHIENTLAYLLMTTFVDCSETVTDERAELIGIAGLKKHITRWFDFKRHLLPLLTPETLQRFCDTPENFEFIISIITCINDFREFINCLPEDRRIDYLTRIDTNTLSKCIADKLTFLTENLSEILNQTDLHAFILSAAGIKLIVTLKPDRRGLISFIQNTFPTIAKKNSFLQLELINNYLNEIIGDLSDLRKLLTKLFPNIKDRINHLANVSSNMERLKGFVSSWYDFQSYWLRKMETQDQQAFCQSSVGIELIQHFKPSLYNLNDYIKDIFAEDQTREAFYADLPAGFVKASWCTSSSEIIKVASTLYSTSRQRRIFYTEILGLKVLQKHFTNNYDLGTLRESLDANERSTFFCSEVGVALIVNIKWYMSDFKNFVTKAFPKPDVRAQFFTTRLGPRFIANSSFSISGIVKLAQTYCQDSRQRYELYTHPLVLEKLQSLLSADKWHKLENFKDKLLGSLSPEDQQRFCRSDTGVALIKHLESAKDFTTLITAIFPDPTTRHEFCVKSLGLDFIKSLTISSVDELVKLVTTVFPESQQRRQFYTDTLGFEKLQSLLPKANCNRLTHFKDTFLGTLSLEEQQRFCELDTGVSLIKSLELSQNNFISLISDVFPQTDAEGQAEVSNDTNPRYKFCLNKLGMDFILKFVEETYYTVDNLVTLATAVFPHSEMRYSFYTYHLDLATLNRLIRYTCELPALLNSLDENERVLLCKKLKDKIKSFDLCSDSLMEILALLNENDRLAYLQSYFASDECGSTDRNEQEIVTPFKTSRDLKNLLSMLPLHHWRDFYIWDIGLNIQKKAVNNVYELRHIPQDKRLFFYTEVLPIDELKSLFTNFNPSLSTFLEEIPCDDRLTLLVSPVGIELTNRFIQTVEDLTAMLNLLPETLRLQYCLEYFSRKQLLDLASTAGFEIVDTFTNNEDKCIFVIILSDCFRYDTSTLDFTIFGHTILTLPKDINIRIRQLYTIFTEHRFSASTNMISEPGNMISKKESLSALNKSSALFRAAMNQFTVEELEQRDNNNSTLLLYAAYYGLIDVCIALAVKGVALDTKDSITTAYGYAKENPAMHQVRPFLNPNLQHRLLTEFDRRVAAINDKTDTDAVYYKLYAFIAEARDIKDGPLREAVKIRLIQRLITFCKTRLALARYTLTQSEWSQRIPKLEKALQLRQDWGYLKSLWLVESSKDTGISEHQGFISAGADAPTARTQRGPSSAASDSAPLATSITWHPFV